MSHGVRFFQNDQTEPAADSGRCIAAAVQFRALGQEVFKYQVGVGGNGAEQGGKQASPEGAFTGAQELVENQYPAAGFEDAAGFCEGSPGMGYDGEYEMHDDHIETIIREGQSLGVGLNKREMGRQALCVAEHGVGEIDADGLAGGRQIRNIQPGADAIDQDATGRRRNVAEAALPQGCGEGAHRRIINGRPERIGAL